LVFIDSSGKKRAFTQKGYLIQVLSLYIESILEDFGVHIYTLGLESLFIKDNNSVYSYKSEGNYCVIYRTKHGIILIPYPSTSPDMNPIEKY
jgi:hypothetical protein